MRPISVSPTLRPSTRPALCMRYVAKDSLHKRVRRSVRASSKHPPSTAASAAKRTDSVAVRPRSSAKVSMRCAARHAGDAQMERKNAWRPHPKADRGVEQPRA